MQDTPAAQHKFLPIVTLGQEEDKNIRWGATLPDEHGNYYYPSFLPLSFIVPYAFFTLTGLPLSETSLYIFSAALGAACWLLLLRLLLKVFTKRLPAWFITVTSFALYFFSPEMLHSNGSVFGGQHLFQLVFLGQLNIFGPCVHAAFPICANGRLLLFSR